MLTHLTQLEIDDFNAFLDKLDPECRAIVDDILKSELHRTGSTVYVWKKHGRAKLTNEIKLKLLFAIRLCFDDNAEIERLINKIYQTDFAFKMKKLNRKV
jgi:hypothetical protein